MEVSEDNAKILFCEAGKALCVDYLENYSKFNQSEIKNTFRKKKK